MSKRISAFTVEVNLDLFISDCANCGIVFGIPVDLEKRRRKDHAAFYCPNGHNLVFSGPTEAEREAKAAKERADRLYAKWMAERDQSEAAQREAAEAKASEVRLRWRVGNGVCPCCSRTFQALAAHVATKHPDFVHRDLNSLSVRMRELLANLRRITEDEDTAVVDVNDNHLPWTSIRALERRGFVATVGYGRVALTEEGWPLAEQAASQPS